MNGATTELWAKINNNPSKSKAATIGTNHHIFSLAKKLKSSLTIPSLWLILVKNFGIV
ncbi:MAG: hypothetical protein UV61_C0024G0008 [Candidatus Gottesmanbacteria bacterium GW2011_GWB1_43_11]|uniref:Uncharacterized protein n=1 Tax=Candidatus Gottesmanbacteria bacterium GW2011_GWB1_43_11 TaxID=1618446 RepID=A0A0G1CH45_9BACT|nr:MAG: hypothetical protein UV04_C0018G0009 [Candidatus Gottesmanbacteria bacterium GW2011_GWA2_42_16]KKS80232.1 MAG: hypothetical protein UV55_C0045G0009 [Candidatus Gottesmanbacteria bacterium GW2011_GWC1_43_10]KKS84794.1 MAG: hypothetical protein UV61_C0024G0008 [Candidatus Gottesmanbacteria bacterium GW2011_GWB1_43_11]